MRAADLCIEAIYSTSHQPFADALAIQALARHLPVATANAQDVAARGRCQLAVWLSLISLDNVMAGLSHAIGHQLGGRYHLPHGVTSRLMLAAVMDFNWRQRPKTSDCSARDGYRHARSHGRGGSRVGIREGSLPGVCARYQRSLAGLERNGDQSRTDRPGTMTEFLLAKNPRRVESAQQVYDIFRAVF